jgi:hypothetical protein
MESLNNYDYDSDYYNNENPINSVKLKIGEDAYGDLLENNCELPSLETACHRGSMHHIATQKEGENIWIVVMQNRTASNPGIKIETLEDHCKDCLECQKAQENNTLTTY